MMKRTNMWNARLLILHLINQSIQSCTGPGKFGLPIGRLSESTNRQLEFSDLSHQSLAKKSHCKITFKHDFYCVLGTWRTMEAPLRHIHCRHLALESTDELTNMSSRIYDTTYFAVFFSNDSRIKSCHLFLLF